MHALRSRERGCFLVVQNPMGGKNSVNNDAGSLNTFGQNEIEVGPISSALLRIACLVILYKTCDQELAADGVSGPVRGPHRFVGRLVRVLVATAEEDRLNISHSGRAKSMVAWNLARARVEKDHPFSSSL